MGVASVRSLGYRTDLAMLVRSGSTVTDRGDHLVVRTDNNPAFWWGNFFLLSTAPRPDETVEWIGRFQTEFPEAHHRAFGVDDPDVGVTDGSGFAAEGYDVEVDTVMTATRVHAPARPNREATYRPLSSDSDWGLGLELALRVHTNETTPETDRVYSTARSHARRRLAESGAGRWFGAFLGDRLVAQMGIVSASPGLARFQDVETHPDFRQRGLAGSLVHHGSGYGFGELGAHTLVMVADPDYPAIRIYHALGFAESEHQLGITLGRIVDSPGAPSPLLIS